MRTSELDLRRQLNKTMVTEGTESLCSFSSSYHKPTSIQHWQLRDLVHCPTTAGHIFSPCGHRIMHHDLASRSTDCVMDLSFQPTSLTVSHGYVAAGGQSSQLDVRRLGPSNAAHPAAQSGTRTTASAAVFRGHVGGSVNNALRIQRDCSGHLRLFVCNNDATIKLVSLRNGGTMVGLVRAPCAVNYCALSNDGRSLVAVTDDRHVILYQATPTGYRQTKRFTEYRDAGMCCDWGPCGHCFAAASQDGVIAVWDHRSSALVALYRTPLACRNVKFSPAPLDLLAFAEHRGRAHLVDQRMWGREQVLHVGASPEMEPDIAGLAFSPCGRALYVATDEDTVAFDVDTVARRSFACAELC